MCFMQHKLTISPLPLEDGLSALTQPASGPCVSLHMPAHVKGSQRRQDPIRFQNLLDEALEGLVAIGTRRPDAIQLLSPAAALLDQPEFWNHPQEGLAIFLGEHLAHYRWLSSPPPQEARVGACFVVRHVLPSARERAEFLLLNLSQQNIRLFDGSSEGLREIDLSGAPINIKELLRFVDEEKSLQFHTGAAPTAGGQRRGAMFHGQGVEEQPRLRTFEFFRKLDEALRDILRDVHAPMILAGDERIVTIFRQATSYPRLFDQAIAGNPDRTPIDELHGRCIELLDHAREANRVDELARLDEALGVGRGAKGLQDVLTAAADGLVETVFVRRDAHAWGRFDEAARSIHLDGEKQSEPGQDDLFELAIIHCLRNSGRARMIEPREAPGGAPIAAVLRKAATAGRGT